MNSNLKFSSVANVANVVNVANSIWIDVKLASELLNVTERTIQRRAAKDFKTRLLSGVKGGNAGNKIEILLSSLPIEAQEKYYLYQYKESNNPNITEGASCSLFSSIPKAPSFAMVSIDDNFSTNVMDNSMGSYMGSQAGESQVNYIQPDFFLDVDRDKPRIGDNSGGEFPYFPPPFSSPDNHFLSQNTLQVGRCNKTDLSDGGPFSSSRTLVSVGGSVTSAPDFSLIPNTAKSVALARFTVIKKWLKFREGIKNNVTNGIENVEKKMRNSSNEENLGRILNLIQDKKISVEKLAGYKNTCQNTIISQVKDGEFQAVTEKSRGRGGQKYLILVSSLPLDLQLRYFQENMPVLAQTGTSLAFLENSSNNYKDNKESKTEQDENFIALYNSGYWKDLYSETGNISRGTLYRWKKLLDLSSGDYQALVPAYQYSSEIEFRSSLSEEEKNIILGLLLNPAKLKIKTAYNYAVMILAAGGMEAKGFAVFSRFIQHYKSQNKDVWVLMRDGEKALCDSVLPYIPRDVSLLEVGQCLIADGHKLDFLVINPFTGKPCRPVMVVFQDWKSTDIAGFEIMVTENTQCVDSALRNSIIRLGKMPEFCYLDNGKSFKNKFFSGSSNFDEAHFMGVYAQLGITTIFATPYNAKAKRVERFFETFTSSFSKLMHNYVGNNIENQPAYMKRNEKFHKKIQGVNRDVLTIEQTTQRINWWLDNYYRKQSCSNVKGCSIGEVFASGIGTGVDPESLNHLMMAKEIRSIRQNGISLFGLKYWCDRLFGIDQQVIVRYSVQDLSYIYVYSTKNEFLCKAELVRAIHPIATHLGDQIDKNNLNAAIRQQRSLKKQTIAKAKKQIRQSQDYMALLPDFSSENQYQPIETETEIIDMTQRYIEEYERGVAAGYINPGT